MQEVAEWIRGRRRRWSGTRPTRRATRRRVKDLVVDSGASQDADILALAKQLLEADDPAGAQVGRYNVQVRDSQGVQVGENNTQTNNFGPVIHGELRTGRDINTAHTLNVDNRVAGTRPWSRPRRSSPSVGGRATPIPRRSCRTSPSLWNIGWICNNSAIDLVRGLEAATEAVQLFEPLAAQLPAVYAGQLAASRQTLEELRAATLPTTS